MVKSLSVVIPAFNEEANTKRCLTSINDVLKKLKIDSEIIFVNDGSKDKTGEVAKGLTKTIKHLKVVENHPNLGYGGSLKRGFEEAKKNFIVFTPADNQFDFSEVTQLIQKQEETDADIVSGIRVDDSDPLHRRFFRWGWNTLVRALFGYLATDVDCGFKLFRRDILKRISLPSDGAMIDTQFFAGARARGMSVAELPVTHLPRTAGKSTGGNPKVIIKALRELAVFWWQLKQEILVEQGRAVFRWEMIILAFIILLASFLRFYKIDQYLTFLGDEGRDVLIVHRMITELHPALIGPQTSIGNMYLGPLYYYLMAIPLLLANFSPVGPAVMVALFGLSTIALIWWIGRQWFGRIPALIVSTLYALSPTVIIHSRSSWNPNIMPFFALIAIYGIWKVWRFGYWRWVIFSAISLAFVLQSHYLGLLLIPTLALFLFFSPKKPGWFKRLAIASVLFLLLMSPLLIFDLRHDWLNTKAFYKFFSDRQTTVNFKAYKSIPNLWPIWLNINASLLTANNILLAQVSSIVLILTSIYSLVKKYRDSKLLFTWLLIGVIGLGLYKQHIYDHYYGFLFPVPFLILGLLIKYTKYLSILLLIPLFFTALANNPLRYSPNNQLAHTRQVAQFIVDQSHNQPFNLALIAKRNYDAGYRYFLTLDQAPLVKVEDQIAGQLFVACEDPVCEPINHPMAEIANFGWAQIDSEWDFPWGTKLFKLTHRTP